jgi:heme-degrading monooxygenase HmoA
MFPYLVVISTFTVSPDQQEVLTRTLSETADRVLRHQPGFLGCSIEASFDGTRVVNHAHWRSEDDLAAMMQVPECREHMTWVRSVASIEPVRYRVASTHTP